VKVAEEDEEFFSTNGYLVIRKLIEPKVCEEILRKAVEASRGERWHPDWNPRGLSALQQLGYFSHLVNESLMTILASRAQAIAEQLLGHEVVLWGDQVIMKPAGCEVQVAWHQDAAYWCNWSDVPSLSSGLCLDDEHSAVTCWVALSDVTPDMAPVCYLPGSHKQRLFHREVTIATDDYNKRDPLYLDPDAVAPYLEKLVRCPLNAGDCTFHDARTMHSSGPNTSPRARYGYALHFWPTSGWDRAANALIRANYYEKKASA
jgi:ectoine hydroxylase-related dioxygenase (phytanoyl-CoA dioxygenase family)